MNRLLPSSFRPVFKTLSILLWLILFALLLHRDFFVRTIDSHEAFALERAKRIEYQSIYFKDKKIGYVENNYLPQQDNTLRIQQQAVMRLNISGQTHPVDLNLDALVGADNTLISFDFTFSSPFYKMSANGTVDNNVVSFQLDTGNSSIKDSVSLEGPPMLSTSRRGYLLNEEIEQGEKVKIPWFDPFSLTAKQSVIEYRGKEKVLISDRVYNLHRFTEVFSGARLNSWLDDEGNVIKEESPAGFVFIREPEFKAKSLSEESADLLASVSVKVIGEMFDLSDKTTARYRLTLPDEPKYELNSGRQHFSDSILTVTKENLSFPPDEDNIICTGAKNELMASPYIQSTAPEIVEQSISLTQNAKSNLERSTALADWVFQYLEKRPVIGIPDALTTLKSKIGDCNEHASLFAALGRAAGIPTKIAVGVVYHKQAFYYHAWNEVCLDGNWISLDTTTNQMPADLSHLKFIEGELQEQIKIGALLNTLQIEPLHD